MRRIYEFLLILLVGGFVYVAIDNAADRMMNQKESDSVDDIISN
tara:strand:+ start:25 stop:156 length:132 start_codon:yes stop_codon:yes gene_type:complete